MLWLAAFQALTWPQWQATEAVKCVLFASSGSVRSPLSWNDLLRTSHLQKSVPPFKAALKTHFYNNTFFVLFLIRETCTFCWVVFVCLRLCAWIYILSAMCWRCNVWDSWLWSVFPWSSNTDTLDFPWNETQHLTNCTFNGNVQYLEFYFVLLSALFPYACPLYSTLQSDFEKCHKNKYYIIAMINITNMCWHYNKNTFL